MNKPALLIRADARPRRGSGHVMRCFALGQAARRRGARVYFLLPPPAGRLEARLRRGGMGLLRRRFRPGGVSDVKATLAAAARVGARWAVVDGYDFDAAYVDALRRGGLRVLFLDDTLALRRYAADAVLNQNLHARPADYRAKGARGRLLLGPRHCLLRPEFSARRPPRRGPVRGPARWLVTMGGTDAPNATLAVLKVLAGLPVREITAAVGAENPHFARLRAWARGRKNVRLRRDVRDMPSLMARTDAAVSASGSTVWELSHMGVPAALVVLAENQAPLARELARRGAAARLDWRPGRPLAGLRRGLKDFAASAARWPAMGRRGQNLVDGRGAARVIKALGAL